MRPRGLLTVEIEFYVIRRRFAGLNISGGDRARLNRGYRAVYYN